MSEILKLLQSQNKEDNILGLELIRAKHPDNWSGFLMELERTCRGHIIEYQDKSGNTRWVFPLEDKYFPSYRQYSELLPYWDSLIQ